MSVALATSLTLIVSGCSNAPSTTVGSGQHAPGVFPTQIDVGSIANVTGPLSSDFAPVVNGVEAYFSMINAEGGVAGRKLKLAHQEDDEGSPTIDLSVAQKLVEQNQVFAVVGVGTPFFGGASFLAQQGTPTFGYAVSTDWANRPTLFGSYGSVLDFATAGPGDSYVAQQLGATSIAVVAYGVAQSADACQAAVSGMRKFGLNVSFTDLNLVYGADPTPAVLQMENDHVDFLLSCLDINGNVAFARAISQNGLTMNQLWLNGYDRGTL
jgi:ABC-type branched-subunit amino acid transport system substrate-binding protein